MLIDESLLPKIQFVREGHFVEKKGAPTLKLVGEVRATTHSMISPSVPQIIREGIDEADVLRNFVRQETVEYPLAYLLRSCHTAKRWLPVFYYAKMSNRPLAEIKRLVAERETTYVASKRQLLERIDGSRTALTQPQGSQKGLLAQLIEGKLKNPKKAIDAAHYALALASLPTASLKLTDALSVLRACTDVARSDPAMKPAYWSNIYKGAARIDELYFRETN